MADLQEAVVTLPIDPASVSAARSYVCERLAEWGLPADPEALEAVRLIVSELATNAVLHACGRSPDFTVLVRLERGEQLHIGVRDRHPRWPQLLPAADLSDLAGPAPGLPPGLAEACPLEDFHGPDGYGADSYGCGAVGERAPDEREDGGRGMVIVGRLADESGGVLRVTPTEEGGKTVWIVLPWAAVPPRRRTAAPSAAQRPAHQA